MVGGIDFILLRFLHQPLPKDHLHRRQQLIRLQLRLGEYPLRHVIECVLDGCADHFLHSGVIHIDGRAFDFHHDILPGGNLAGKHLKDAVRIDLELHANPCLPLGQLLHLHFKFPQLPIVPRHLALALEDADAHFLLVVRGIGEHLPGLAGDGRVARDDHVHQPAEGLDAEAERRHV